MDLDADSRFPDNTLNQKGGFKRCAEREKWDWRRGKDQALNWKRRVSISLDSWQGTGPSANIPGLKKRTRTVYDRIKLMGGQEFKGGKRGEHHRDMEKLAEGSMAPKKLPGREGTWHNRRPSNEYSWIKQPRERKGGETNQGRVRATKKGRSLVPKNLDHFGCRRGYSTEGENVQSELKYKTLCQSRLPTQNLLRGQCRGGGGGKDLHATTKDWGRRNLITGITDQLKMVKTYREKNENNSLKADPAYPNSTKGGITLWIGRELERKRGKKKRTLPF